MQRGAAQVAKKTNADSLIVPAVINLYDRIVKPEFPVRRIGITCNRVVPDNGAEQLTLFDEIDTDKNRILQKTMLKIKAKHGKNAILKGINYIV